MKCKALLVMAFSLFCAVPASATAALSCFARSVQVVEETQNAKVVAVADLETPSFYKGFYVFFEKWTPAKENGVSRIVFWRSSCTVASLRTAKTLEELESGDLDEDALGRN